MDIKKYSKIIEFKPVEIDQVKSTDFGGFKNKGDCYGGCN